MCHNCIILAQFPRLWHIRTLIWCNCAIERHNCATNVCNCDIEVCNYTIEVCNCGLVWCNCGLFWYNYGLKWCDCLSLPYHQFFFENGTSIHSCSESHNCHLMWCDCSILQCNCYVIRVLTITKSSSPIIFFEI